MAYPRPLYEFWIQDLLPAVEALHVATVLEVRSNLLPVAGSVLHHQRLQLIILFCGPPPLLGACLLCEGTLMSEPLDVLLDLLKQIALGLLRVLLLVVTLALAVLLEDVHGEAAHGIAQRFQLFTGLEYVSEVQTEVGLQIIRQIHEFRQLLYAAQPRLTLCQLPRLQQLQRTGFRFGLAFKLLHTG